jgi:hypothetical protein
VQPQLGLRGPQEANSMSSDEVRPGSEETKGAYTKFVIARRLPGVRAWVRALPPDRTLSDHRF